MSCQRMNNLVHAYLDDELSLTEQVQFEQHIATCPECEAAHRAFKKLRQNLRDCSLRFDMPTAMSEKLSNSIPKPADSKPHEFPGYRVLAIAAMLMIVLGGVSMWVMHANRSNAVRDLVDAHVRSLQADHLLDVVSTDQHTVKPWFDGRIDFAPPVKDLTADGFPLQGGRLDYLRNHAVAALVYQRAKHTINLFVWPEQGTDESVKGSTVDGYNVLEWREAGMRQIAVSDLNMQEMQEFASLERSATSPKPEPTSR